MRNLLVKVLKKIFINFFIVFFIFEITPAKVFAQNYNIKQSFPRAIEEYITKNYKSNDEVYLCYIMRWKGYKVYRLKKIYYNKIFTLPEYLLYKNKTVRVADSEEFQELTYKSIISSNKKRPLHHEILIDTVNKNSNKTMKISNIIEPPNVPPELYQYAYKKIIKEKDVRFVYIMDWNNQHVYWAYWPKYGMIKPLTIIFCDNKIIRMPTASERKEINDKFTEEFTKKINKMAEENMDNMWR